MRQFFLSFQTCVTPVAEEAEPRERGETKRGY